MARKLLPVTASLLGLAVLLPSLHAYPFGGAPLLQDRVPQPVQSRPLNAYYGAEYVVVGKVKELEEPLVVAGASAMDQYKSVYRVAVLDVDHVLKGPKDAATVRVGFRLGNAPPLKARELAVGDAGCFFLSKHYEQPFYVIETPYDPPFFAFGFGNAPPQQPQGHDFLEKGSKDYDKDLAFLTRCCTLLDNPDAGLANPQDQFLTAALLIMKYRAPRSNVSFSQQGGFMLNLAPPKTEPIDAEQSRRILAALAAVPDLMTVDKETSMNPLGLFNRLGLQPQDGWLPPQTSMQDFATAAKSWLAANNSIYRIKRIIPDPPPVPARDASSAPPITIHPNNPSGPPQTPPPADKQPRPSAPSSPAPPKEPPPVAAGPPSAVPVAASQPFVWDTNTTILVSIVGGLGGVVVLGLLILLVRRGRAAWAPPRRRPGTSSATPVLPAEGGVAQTQP